MCPGVLWDGRGTDVKLQQLLWILLLPVEVSHTVQTVLLSETCTLVLFAHVICSLAGTASIVIPVLLLLLLALLVVGAILWYKRRMRG